VKKILFTLFILISTLYSSEIKWAKDFQTGVKEATKANKPIFFLFSNHGCKYCVLLANTTLKDKRIIKALNRDFIAIASYTDENDYTPRELWRPGTPTLWFLKPDGEPMFQPIVGAVNAEYFLQALAIVKNEFDKQKK